MRIGRIATKKVAMETCENLSQATSISNRRPALDAGFGFSFATPHSEFCENSSRPYFLRGLRVKEAMPGSREVREDKKSAKGLLYTIAEKLEEAQPRVEHGATGV
jgi:hypothetical protein